MKTIFFQPAAAVLTALALAAATGSLAPSQVAAQNVTNRPIGEFVAAQGTFDLGVLFVPPVPNFFGWTDSNAGLGLSIDYAGLADETCGGVAGTTFDGTIKERQLDDARAEVIVELETFDAITWVIDGFDFSSDPVIFGTVWEEDENGDCVINGPLALGDSQMKVTFINPKPGDPIPDLIQLVVFPQEGQELVSLKIHAVATGLLPDGTPAQAETHQVIQVKDGELTVPVEKVFIETLD